MRLLAWNIRAGGGARIAMIVEALAQHDADILVLSEYRSGLAGDRLRAELAVLGYRWVTASQPPPGANGVLIAARHRLRELGPVSPNVPEPWRMLGVAVGRLRVAGIYMPNLRAKVPYWEALIASLTPRAGDHTLAVGDFNTCRAWLDEPGAIDVTAHFLDRVEAAGFHDVWRHRFPERREFSWFSHRGNGFRVDHAFFSASLARRAGAIRYSHTERERGLSDHSPLLIELQRRGGGQVPADWLAAR
jgi:exodeoxyribonuclease III